MISSLTKPQPLGVYFRSKPLNRYKAIMLEEEPDYASLQVLLSRYDSDISLERAKQIGAFLLRIHMLVNKADLKDEIDNKMDTKADD